jgi:putative transport protein
MCKTPDQTAAMASLMAIAYAVTYPFGTAGGAWFLSSFAPNLLGIDLRNACQEYDAATKDQNSELDEQMANPPLLARSFGLENDKLVGHTLGELNIRFETDSGGAFITRQREGDRILEAGGTTVVARGATLAIAGPPHALLQAKKIVGYEIEAATRTVGDLERDELPRYGRPVFVLRLTRAGHAVPLSPGLKIKRCNVLTVGGGGPTSRIWPRCWDTRIAPPASPTCHSPASASSSAASSVQ